MLFRSNPLKIVLDRDFPAVQWLRLCASNAGVAVPTLVGELRSHMPGDQEQTNKKTALDQGGFGRKEQSGSIQRQQ